MSDEPTDGLKFIPELSTDTPRQFAEELGFVEEGGRAMNGEDFMAPEVISAMQGRPVADPSETLALIAEHQMTVQPWPQLAGWMATVEPHSAWGSTIGDAVRLCAEKVRGLSV